VSTTEEEHHEVPGSPGRASAEPAISESKPPPGTPSSIEYDAHSSPIEAAPRPSGSGASSGAEQIRLASSAFTLPRFALAGSGVLLFVSLFIHWYHFSYSNAYTGDSFSRGANAWRLFSTLQVFLCIFAVALVAFAVVDFLIDRSRPTQPRASGLPLIALVLGSLTALLAFIHIFDKPYATLFTLAGASETTTTGVVLALVAGLIAMGAATQLAVLRHSFRLASEWLGGWGARRDPTPRLHSQLTTDTGSLSGPSPRRSASYLEDLERLDDLRRKGVLTEEEFTHAKAALLVPASRHG
jgi:hypothetical protein